MLIGLSVGMGKLVGSPVGGGVVSDTGDSVGIDLGVGAVVGVGVGNSESMLMDIVNKASSRFTDRLVSSGSSNSSADTFLEAKAF